MKKEKTKIIGVVTSGVVMLGVAMFLFVKPQYNIIKAEENNNIETSQIQEIQSEPQFVEVYVENDINDTHDYAVEKYYTMQNDLKATISNLNDTIKAEESSNIEAGQSQEVDSEPQAIASYAKAKINAAYDYKVEKYYTLLNDLQTIISNLNNDN